MGCDPFQIQDILEEKGIWQNDMSILMDAMAKGQYFNNPLKVQQVAMPPPMQQPMMGGMPQQQFMSQPGYYQH